MTYNQNEQHGNELDEQQTGSVTPLNDESGEGATTGSGTATGTHDEERDYEGGALGSAGSGTQLKEDNTSADRGSIFTHPHSEETGDPLTSPGINREEKDYEGGALGSAGSGTGALDESES